MEAVGETGFTGSEEKRLLRLAEVGHYFLDPARFAALDDHWLSSGQIAAVKALSGERFVHKWQLAQALAGRSPEWALRDNSPRNKLYNREIQQKLDYLYRTLSVASDSQ
jgi:PiT family inorganic phosphate transporter